MPRYVVRLEREILLTADDPDAAIDWALDTSGITSDWVTGVERIGE